MQAGEQIGRYTVEQELGSGGMATVYKIRHEALGSAHALKVLTATSKFIRSRLIQEGRAQAGLAHKNIVRVTDVIEIEGAPGLVMQYIDGPDLRTWLLDNRADTTQALRLFVGIVRGVRHAHKKGLIHRDLKPANVLLATSDEEMVPKLMDFGLVKVISDAVDLDRGNNTAEGVAMGTPEYMAPEQIRNARRVDARADMFSLGCILYELLAGQRAFSAESTLMVFTQVSLGQYESLESLVPSLPNAVKTVVDGLLDPEPAHRIPDCDTVLNLLAGDDAVAAVTGLDKSWTVTEVDWEPRDRSDPDTWVPLPERKLVRQPKLTVSLPALFVIVTLVAVLAVSLTVLLLT